MIYERIMMINIDHHLVLYPHPDNTQSILGHIPIFIVDQLLEQIEKEHGSKSVQSIFYHLIDKRIKKLARELNINEYSIYGIEKLQSVYKIYYNSN